MPAKSASRYYLLTLNNPTYAIEEELGRYLQDGIIKGYNCNLEIGEENGTLHYQFMVCFPRDKKPGEVKKLWPEAHNEICRDEFASWKYCAKSATRVDGPWTGGQGPRGQGHRSDINELRAAILAGASDVDLFTAFPRSYLAYYRGIQHIRLRLNKPRSEPTELHVLIGETGTGKTRFVYENEPSLYWKQSGSDWWDGYNNESAIILDDFYGWMKPHDMLRLCDRYPLMVQTKGGQATMNSKRVYITSNKHVRDWWRKEVQDKYDMRALHRRVTTVRVFEDDQVKLYNSYEEYEIAHPLFNFAILPASPVM